MNKITRIFGGVLGIVCLSTVQGEPIQATDRLRDFYIQNGAQLQRTQRELETRQARSFRRNKFGTLAPYKVDLGPQESITQEDLKGWQYKGPSDALEVKNASTGEIARYPLQGVDLTRVKKELKLKTTFRPKDRVVVAVSDGGANMYHEFIAPYAYQNGREALGDHGRDDDRNGFSDDLSGWDFIGAGIRADTLELARVKYLCDDGLIQEDAGSGRSCEELQKAYNEDVEGCQGDIDYYGTYYPLLAAVDRYYSLGFLGDEGLIASYRKKSVAAKLGREKFEVRDALRREMVLRLVPVVDQASESEHNLYDWVIPIRKSEPKGKDNHDRDLVSMLLTRLLFNDHQGWIEKAYEAGRDCKIRYAREYAAKRTPGYDSSNPSRPYGSSQSAGIRPSHGTHVAGIVIGVLREALGDQASKNALRVMSVRVTPDADERDHDVANAVRYAVDNGAHLVNMSFGKDYSPYKSYVDDAFSYAETKGVGLILSAGNDAREVLPRTNFPSPASLGGKRFSNVVIVGASNFINGAIPKESVPWPDRKVSNSRNHRQIMAAFSNYSRDQVDVFAPGTMIYSTYSDVLGENDSWAFLQGTSMASPVVTGVSALVLSQVPDLRYHAADLREILIRSVRTFDHAESTIDGKNVDLSTASLSGGILDAYLALCNASAWSKARGGSVIQGCKS